jgi:prevent-host-death family protein
MAPRFPQADDAATADAPSERLGVRELRRDLAAHVRRAEAGHRVVITVGGRPAAMLGPTGADPAARPDLDALVAAGSVIGPRRTGPPAGQAAQPVPIWSGVRLDRALRDVRG